MRWTGIEKSPVFKTTRRVVVAIAGMLGLIAGIIMLITPGPGMLLIPASLWLLATEFKWAHSALEKLKQTRLYKAAVK